MTIADRYAPLIKRLNEMVDRFNVFLAQEARFQPVDPEDAQTFSDVAGVAWDDHRWPSKDTVGVYLLCGSLGAGERFAAYVGKASQKEIGYRLWHHLHPQRPSEKFFVPKSWDDPFPLEVILAISVAEDAPAGLASALEEFILQHGIDGVEFFNSTGNRSKA